MRLLNKRSYVFLTTLKFSKKYWKSYRNGFHRNLN